MKKTLLKIYEFFRKKTLFFKRRFVKPDFPKNKDGKIYINLGCGPSSGKEFINIDVLPYPNIHYIQNIENLSMFKDNSVDMVYASHVVEHIPKEKLKKILLEWHRILKPGGVFRFAVPDFDSLIDIYLRKNDKNVEYVRDQILGQDPPYNNHYTLWNFNYAKKILTELGYKNIKIWDPNKVDNHNFVDRSSRFLLVENEEIYFSLNVEAKKAII